VVGLIIGAGLTVGGVLLFLHGIAGQTNWMARLLGPSGRFTDAAFGAVCGLLGTFIIWVTRFKVKAASGREADWPDE
jgi:hypothetical protein